METPMKKKENANTEQRTPAETLRNTKKNENYAHNCSSFQTPLSVSRSVMAPRQARRLQEQKTIEETKKLKEARRKEKEVKLRAEEEKRLRQLRDLQSREQKNAQLRKRLAECHANERKMSVQQAAEEAAQRLEEERLLKENMKMLEKQRRRRSNEFRRAEREWGAQWQDKKRNLEKQNEDLLLETRKLNSEDDMELMRQTAHARRYSLIMKRDFHLRLKKKEEDDNIQKIQEQEQDWELRKLAWQDTQDSYAEENRRRRESMYLQGVRKKEERALGKEQEKKAREEEIEDFQLKKMDFDDVAAYNLQKKEERRKSLESRAKIKRQQREIDRTLRKTAQENLTAEIIRKKAEMDDVESYKQNLEAERRQSLAWHADQQARLKMLRNGEVKAAQEAEKANRLAEQENRKAYQEYVKAHSEERRKSIEFRRQQIETDKALRKELSTELIEQQALKYQEWKDLQEYKTRLEQEWQAHLLLDRQEALKQKEFDLQKSNEEKERLQKELESRYQDAQDFKKYQEMQRKLEQEAHAFCAQEFKKHMQLEKEINRMIKETENEEIEIRRQERSDVLEYMAEQNKLRIDLLLSRRDIAIRDRHFKQEKALLSAAEQEKERLQREEDRKAVEEYLETLRNEAKDELLYRYERQLYSMVIDRIAADNLDNKTSLDEEYQGMSNEDSEDLRVYDEAWKLAHRKSLLLRASAKKSEGKRIKEQKGRACFAESAERFAGRLAQVKKKQQQQPDIHFKTPQKMPYASHQSYRCQNSTQQLSKGSSVQTDAKGDSTQIDLWSSQYLELSPMQNLGEKLQEEYQNIFQQKSSPAPLVQMLTSFDIIYCIVNEIIQQLPL